jgi:sulfatase modifying factor 1
MKIGKHVLRALVLSVASCIPLAIAGPALATITIATVPVGNAGNAADPSTTYGAVSYNYNIGKYDVTEGQYTAFLNAVATTSDTYSLYNSYMAMDYSNSGITQSGSAGSYTYATSTPNFPVTDVTFWDATRFANWLSNGQPTGAEGSSTTENGTYTLTSTGISNNTVTRNANATYWAVASENEWYKAAYYNPTNSSYYLYPTQSNTQEL